MKQKIDKSFSAYGSCTHVFVSCRPGSLSCELEWIS